jgi:hypothetical protein
MLGVATHEFDNPPYRRTNKPQGADGLQMLRAGADGQSFGMHVELLGRHVDSSLSKGDFQVSSEIRLSSARSEIDGFHRFFDLGPAFRALTSSLLLTKSLLRRTLTGTPSVPLGVADRSFRRYRTSGMTLALTENGDRCAARPGNAYAPSSFVATAFVATGLTIRGDVRTFRFCRHQSQG